MIRRLNFNSGLLAALLLFGCTAGQYSDRQVLDVDLKAPEGRAVAAFASGCFWCTEHIFESLPGVDSAISGYAGGHHPAPTYEIVNTDTTGHAEAVLIYYDPSVVSFQELVRVFFLSHDPTTPNQQGPDVGTSYRSILFYQNAEEKKIAEESIASFRSQFKDPIVTEVKPLDAFYRAEGYHQDYICRNPNEPYVRGVSIPRFEMFKSNYDGPLKPNP